MCVDTKGVWIVSNLAKVLKEEHGCLFLTKTQLIESTGFCRRTLDKLLAGLTKVEGKYYVEDVAERLTTTPVIKKRRCG